MCVYCDICLNSSPLKENNSKLNLPENEKLAFKFSFKVGVMSMFYIACILMVVMPEVS